MKSRKITLNQKGFSLIEALIGAALIAVISLGLGSSLNFLKKSREKSQSTSLSVEVESALINTLQDPSTYSSIASTLQSGGNPPSEFRLKVILDPASGNGFSISPGQTIYLTENLQACQNFNSSSCVMMVALSPWGKNIPLPGMYSFAYSIQTNPSVSAQPSLGAATTTFTTADYTLTVPSLSNSGKIAQCAANAIGLLGVDASGQAICLYYSGASAECPDDSLPKGFTVIPDAGDPHRYYLGYQCAPMRQVTCPQSSYSFQSFNPASMDSAASTGGPAGTCVYIGAPSSAPVNISGTDGMTVDQLCPTAYVTAATPTCAISGTVVGHNVTCGTGQTLTANTSGVTTKLTASGNSVTCQSVVPQQQCCSDNNSNCTSVTAPIAVNYSCVLDPSHQPITVN